ncbi:hypothetical protein BBF96_14165 [Anoxybacter fermentans]|uniref:Asparagine synthase n=1 Tax=Anoxybacter fermentans TaxID=1323375 RepID=A0A3S9T1M0_9FIRM|nr:hypothetical protein [Anoxybacter fermentans]AZR74429.1 hypothetical protein BBF96_14165 [Anoxybacter fermentans]
MKKIEIPKKPSTTSWVVSGLGLLVSALGARMLKKKVGAGILGFGLAHILLGQLDRFRPTVNEH